VTLLKLLSFQKIIGELIISKRFYLNIPIFRLKVFYTKKGRGISLTFVKAFSHLLYVN
jgi:hypothetical protein